MATNNKVLIDSNYFIALFNTKDSSHKKAVELSQKLSKDKVQVYITNFITLEVLTVLSQKVGRQASINVGNMLQETKTIDKIHITRELNKNTWHIFQSISNKNMSFVNCSNLASMQYMGIKQLLTFDITDFSPLRKQYSFNLYK